MEGDLDQPTRSRPVRVAVLGHAGGPGPRSSVGSAERSLEHWRGRSRVVPGQPVCGRARMLLQGSWSVSRFRRSCRKQCSPVGIRELGQGRRAWVVRDLRSPPLSGVQLGPLDQVSYDNRNRPHAHSAAPMSRTPQLLSIRDRSLLGSTVLSGNSWATDGTPVAGPFAMRVRFGWCWSRWPHTRPG
jgi:hypothetical protein